MYILWLVFCFAFYGLSVCANMYVSKSTCVSLDLCLWFIFSCLLVFPFLICLVFLFLDSCLHPNDREKGMMWIWAGGEDLGGVRGIGNHYQTILYKNLFLIKIIIICSLALYLDAISNSMILTRR